MQPDLITLFIIASASSVAGVLAGMLGIGGGIVIVPMLYYLLTYFGFDQSIIMHIAVGTSLFIIIPTGLRSAFEHSKRGSFDESIFRRWCIPIALGSILAKVPTAPEIAQVEISSIATLSLLLFLKNS